jgi:hypothetical protein
LADVAWTVQGAETKVVQNSHVAPSKRSDVERLVNQCIYIVFALQVNHHSIRIRARRSGRHAAPS